tara:strand:- start:683 stop:844 length:162 start_codon:yes stop_codon:yes gene_type:complete
MSEFNQSTFEGLSDFDLVLLRKKAMEFDEDDDFVRAIMEELNRRAKEEDDVSV